MIKFVRNTKFLGSTAGFTLVEIILTILIAAILGVVAIQFSGTSLSMSASTVIQLKNRHNLNAIMEQITRDYRIWLEENPADSITVFENQIKTNYPQNIDVAATGTDSSFFVDATGDMTIGLLHLTLTDGTQSLVALFTK